MVCLRRIWVDFYEVVLPPESGLAFDELLEQIANNEKDRVQERYGAAHFLQTLEQAGDLLFGLNIRVRMDRLPQRARLDRTVRELDLAEDEGLGEETSFAYSPRHGVLMLQRNGSGTRASTLLWYLEQTTGIAPIELRPVIGEEAMRKLQRMGIVRRFEVALASGQNPGNLRGQGHSVDRMIELLDAHAAATISVTMGMGKGPRKRSMNIQSVVELVRSLFRIRSGDESSVQRLVVTGRVDEEEPQEPLDLLTNRVQERIGVEHVGRRLPASACRNALLEAFRRQEQALDRLYRN